MGSIDDIFKDQRKTRSPLYDELSIPFIDASLPPTIMVEGKDVSGQEVDTVSRTSSKSRIYTPGK